MKAKIVRYAVPLCRAAALALLLTGCDPTAGATDYEVIYPSGYSRVGYTYDEGFPIEGSFRHLQWEKANGYEKTHGLRFPHQILYI